VVELILPVASALARAHELGIVHRDLKPENVLVTPAGQVKVLDFGIAKALGSNDVPGRAQLADLAGQSLTLTREGSLVGTLPYMAPEQVSGGVDHRVDLFAAGVIMFEMLTGTHPVEPLTTDALIHNLVGTTPMRSLRALAPEIPETLAEVVDACLRKSKHERIASAAELARWLEVLVPGRRVRSLSAEDNPYPGLTAFQESDADRFFGRSRDVARMVARIRELPLTAVVGPSGVGKSSFIRAGVGPALKASGESWDVIALRPGRNPIAALAGIVQRFSTRSSQTGQPIEVGPEQAQVLQRLYREPGYLGTVLRERARNGRGNVLLFVDQFEELYTLVPAINERRAFTAALAGVADDPTAPLRVVVSMRSDFVDRIAEDSRFLDEMSRGLVFLSAPDREGLRDAIVQPIEMVGYRFETSPIVDDMLDALSGTPGALPLLQFAASKLWDARDRERRLLTAASYHAIGGIGGALATHADDVIANMNAAAQRLAQRVFRQLVTPERTRAIVELSDLQELVPDREEVTRVIDQLVAARLLVVQMRSDSGGSVELVHESLIDRWPTLRRWLDEDQEDAAFVAQLAVAAKQWDAKDRRNGLLWRGDAMEEARRWYTQRPRTLAPRDRDFIEAVLALARRGKRMRRAALISAFVVLGAIAAGAIVALLAVRDAEQRAQAKAGEASRAAADAEQALAQMKKEQDERMAADARRVAAEDRQRAAEAQKAAAQAEIQEKTSLVQQSREELEQSIRAEKAAREKAERAFAKAEQAAADARRAQAALEAALDREKARVKHLQEETKKLSTKLK
jgi:hypothetical protein